MCAKKTTILVADDDPQLLRLVAYHLQFEDYEVLMARDGQQALEQIEDHAPDLVLLDVMMPKMDGYTVCQRVREFSIVPIIMVTVRGQEQEIIRGLDLGADVYLPKPFSVDELLARVRAVLRRAKLPANGQAHLRATTIIIGELAIDVGQHVVKRAGREVGLTPTEYRLLAYLAHHVGRIVTQNMLLEHVWGAAYADESHLLQVNISRLRSKLEPDPAHPRYILTKAGIGYVLPVQVEEQVA